MQLLPLSHSNHATDLMLGAHKTFSWPKCPTSSLLARDFRMVKFSVTNHSMNFKMVQSSRIHKFCSTLNTWTV